MIAHIWHGRVPAVKANAYYDYLLRTGVPDYRRTPGNRGVCVLRRVSGRCQLVIRMRYFPRPEGFEPREGVAAT